MADNVSVDEGADKAIATDEVAGVHYQKIKLDLGGDGIASPLVRGQQTKADSIPVALASDSDTLPVSADSLPLPTGAATAANQQTDALTDAELRATAVPVSADSLPLPTGASTAAAQGTANTALAAIQTAAAAIQAAVETIDNAIAGTEMQVDVVSSALPTGGATAANQTTGNTALAAIQTAVEILDNIVSGSEAQVDIVSSALPSGAATEATLASIKTAAELLDNAISGNELQVDVVTSALPTGAATSAKQDTAQTSLTAIAAPQPASLGQKTMAASYPVVLPSDQPVNVNVENAIIPSASEYETDSDYTDGDIGGFIVGVRNEALRGFTTADDKFSPLAVDAKGRIYAHVQTTSEADSGLSLDGSAGTYASTPDHADLDITGDLDIRVAVDLDVWTGTTRSLVHKGSTGLVSFAFLRESGGTLQLYTSADGSALVPGFSTASPTPGTAGLLVRATLDVNNGAGSRVYKFYTKPLVVSTYMTDLTSDAGWTQLGSTVTTAGTTSIFNSAEAVTLGGTNPFGHPGAAGTYYGLVIENGYDGAGTAVTNPNFGAQTPGTTSFADTASTPKTWTLNGNAEITGDQTQGLKSDPDGSLRTSQGSGYVGGYQVKVAKLEATAATTRYTVVSAVTGKKIRVIGGWLSQAGTGNNSGHFESGTTDITAPFYLVARAFHPLSAPPGAFLFETAAGAALSWFQDTGDDTSIHLVYIEVD